jgi:hypothetical protein
VDPASITASGSRVVLVSRNAEVMSGEVFAQKKKDEWRGWLVRFLGCLPVNCGSERTEDDGVRFNGVHFA